MTRYLRGFDSLTAYHMRKLSIFDDGDWVATITVIDGSSFLFARTPREWNDVKRLMDAVEIGADLLQSVASLAHNYNYSTELINE